MSSSLLLQQCPACLARRTCIVFVMGGKCPYNWSLVGCCRQDLTYLKYVEIVFIFKGAFLLSFNSVLTKSNKISVV